MRTIRAATGTAGWGFPIALSWAASAVGLFGGALVTACSSASHDAANVAASTPADGGADRGDAGAGDAGASTDDGDAAGDPSSDGGGAGADGGAFVPAAFAGAMPQVKDRSGPVLAAPRIVVVTFGDDSRAGPLEKLAAALGASTYWKTVTAEYGVGAATAGTPVRSTETLPASMTDADVQAFVAARVTGTNPAFGAADANAIYTLFVPSTTTVIGPGDKKTGCQGFSGYHQEITLPGGTNIAYAVVLDCSHKLANATATFTHEMLEAATDPFPATAPAYPTVAPRDAAWNLGHGTELGDMCEAPGGGGSEVDAELGQTVARGWSNEAARAGHDPCRPSPAGKAFFAAMPTSLPDAIPTTMGGAHVSAGGFAIAAGASRTIDLGLYSDAPTGPWTVDAAEADDPTGTGVGPLSFAFDRTSGANGDHVALTISVAAGTAKGPLTYVVSSKLGSDQHLWYGYVGVE